MRKLALVFLLVLLAALTIAPRENLAAPRDVVITSMPAPPDLGAVIEQGLTDTPQPPVPREIIITSLPEAQPNVTAGPPVRFTKLNLEALEDPHVVLVDRHGVERNAVLKDVVDAATGKKTKIDHKGHYTFAINLSHKKELRIQNLSVDAITPIKFEEVNGTGFIDSVAVDLSNLKFGTATYTAIATQPELYKCKYWDFAAQQCAGSWVKLQDLIIGQPFTITLSPDDPGFGQYNSSASESEQSTNSTTPVTAIQLNFTPTTAQQFLLLGYGEIQSGDNVNDIRALLILNTTLNIGNISVQPDTDRTGNPPGDYQPFFSHVLLNLTTNQKNLSVQFFNEVASNTTFIRRARAIALKINQSDALTNDSGNAFTRVTTAAAFNSITNLSFRPAQRLTLLVIASAEVTPNSTSNSVRARLLVNNTPQANIELEGEVVSDVDLFATHYTIMNAPANVTQNFTLQGQSETASNKSIRRARITVIPFSNETGFVFSNESNSTSFTDTSTVQNKTVLFFNLTSDQEVLVIGSADVNASNNTNGKFVAASLFVDNDEIGNMTEGAGDATDGFSFITVRQQQLPAGMHTATLSFRSIGTVNNVTMSNARITVIPIAAAAIPPPNLSIVTCPVTINVTTNLTQNFSANLTGTQACITLGASDMVLDCSGFVLQGNRSGHGIEAINKMNVTIRNCFIMNFSDGIFLDNVNNSLIFNNTVLNNSDDGIQLADTNFTRIFLNNVSANFDDNIVLIRSMSNNISNNSFQRAAGTTSANGILLFDNSWSNLIINNTVRNNADDGISLSDSSDNNTVASNIVLNHAQDGIDIDQSRGNLVRFNLVSNATSQGIEVHSSNYTRIEFNNVTNTFDDAISLAFSESNNLTDNLILNASGTGTTHCIRIFNLSHNNRVINNTVNLCDNDNIRIENNSDRNIVINNTMERAQTHCLHIIDSLGNIVTFNIFRNCAQGGAILSDANGTLVSECLFLNNTATGISLIQGSSHNIFQLNSIINHTAAGADGIEINSETTTAINNTFEYNTITNTGDDGIQLLNRTVDTRILFNNISNTVGDGVIITSGRTVNMTGNNFTNIGGRGIRAFNVVNITVTRNFFRNTSNHFINLENVNTSLIENNTIISNNLFELVLINANATTILDSRFKNYSFTNAGLTVRDTGFGQIAFLNRSITRTGINWSFDVKIGLNSSMVNDSNAPQLNFSANITFFNLNFSNFTIEVDFLDNGSFIECPATICSLLSNNQTTQEIKINVTGWSTYRVKPRRLITVLNLSPFAGQSFLINETVNLTANATSGFSLIDTVIAQITLPNGTIITIPMFNASINIFNATLFGDNLLQRGQYNITFIGNDTQNEIGVSFQTFFFRRAFKVIDVRLRILNPEENETDANFTFMNYTVTVVANASGTLNLSIAINESRVKVVNVTLHDEFTPYSVLDIDDWEFAFRGSFASYGINPISLNFSNMTLTVNATGQQLFKCANYNFSSRGECGGNYTLFYNNLIAGQLYTLNLTLHDPGFSETSAATDVALTPVSNETFVIAWVDNATSSVRVKVQNTTGINSTNDTVVDSTVDNQSRVDVSMLNRTHFVVAWVDGPSDAVRMQLFNLTNGNTSGVITVDPLVATNTDVSIAEIGDRFAVCYSNDDDDDADFQMFNNSNGSQVVTETAADTDMGNEATLQNLVDCAGVNNTRWVYSWFDDTSNDASHRITDQAGGFLTTVQDFDANVGEIAQVAVTAVDNNKFAMVWYDAVDQDITIAINDINNNVVLAPTDIDTLAGTESRVAIAAVRQNENVTNDSFVVAWWNQSSNQLMAAVFNGSGTNTTNPFTVDTQSSANFRLLDVHARDPVTNNSICPGHFVVAYSNTSAVGVFKGFEINGTLWDGTCAAGRADLVITALNITYSNDYPEEGVNITIFANVFNIGTAAAASFIVQFFDGSVQINGNTTITTLLGGQNQTVNVTYFTIIGNRTITVLVDPLNTVVEVNETNNNATRQLNVQSFTTYTGNLSGNITLEDATDDRKYDFGPGATGNIYVSDINSSYNFTALQALGRNKTGAAAIDDFLDAEFNLNSTAFNDSVKVLWANGSNSTPRATATFAIFNNTILLVPVINSTNSSTFITGILWDTQDDTNGEYDITDDEDLVFVSNITFNQSGGLGQIVDYEIRFASLVRQLKPDVNLTSIFVEFR